MFFSLFPLLSLIKKCQKIKIKKKSANQKDHITLFFFSFSFNETVLYYLHSSIDLWGEKAQGENDK